MSDRPRGYRVPSKDYALQYRALMPEVLAEFERVLLAENPVLGDSVQAFETEFAGYTGTRHAVGVNSGTDALVLSLRALGLSPGDEVIVPANTFMASITAILLVGARPVLVDPDPTTLNLTADRAAPAITARARALLVVHLYGALAPMPELLALARSQGLEVVEDAAQAHGARDRSGCCAGASGRFGCFSFHPSKNLGAFGDGGLITTSDAGAVEVLRRYRNLGKANKYEFRHAAPNTKLDTLQAALLRIKLRHLDAGNARRRVLAARYRDALDGVGDLVLPVNPGGEAHVYHLFVIRTEARDALRSHLREQGINAGIHYPIPPHGQPLDVDLGYRVGAFPVTEVAARTVLSLPISPELTDAQVDLVCDQVRSFFGA